MKMMTNEEAIRIATGLRTDFKCESDTMVDFCNTVINALEQTPKKDEVILTKEEYRKLVSSEFDNGYAKGYEEAVANSNLEYQDILNKIEDLLNSSNRGTCDYFIVDKIEEIINEHREKESEEEKEWEM